jgi:hypothetical protein
LLLRFDAAHRAEKQGSVGGKDQVLFGRYFLQILDTHLNMFAPSANSLIRQQQNPTTLPSG